MSKKSEIKELISDYMEVRKSIYNSLQALDESSRIKLNTKKHDLTQEMLNLVNDREYEQFAKSFQTIIRTKIAGCTAKDMEGYIRSDIQNKYFNCLELQRVELENLVDQTIRSKVTILDLEDGIGFCNGEVHNGICYPE